MQQYCDKLLAQAVDYYYLYFYEYKQIGLERLRRGICVPPSACSSSSAQKR